MILDVQQKGKICDSQIHIVTCLSEWFNEPTNECVTVLSKLGNSKCYVNLEEVLI